MAKRRKNQKNRKSNPPTPTSASNIETLVMETPTMETPTNPTTTNRTTIIVDDTPASTVDIDQQKDQDPEPSLIDTTPTPVVDTPAMKLFNDDDDDNIGTENTSNPLKTPAKSDNASISAKYDGNENNKRPLSLPPGVTLRAKAVDLVTGRAVSEYFFDPTLILDENTVGTVGSSSYKTPRRQQSMDSTSGRDSVLFSSRHLYHPCTIVKMLDDSNSSSDASGGNSKNVSGPALVKTSDGTLYKINNAEQLMPLTSPDDYVGMADVLHLANVSEASLLHTLRIRYKRDDIYTNAGPILISLNPYKPISLGNGESLYSERMMMNYRTSEGFCDEPPHLFQVADRAYSAMMDSVHSVPHLEDDDHSHVIESRRSIGMTPGQVVNQSIIISGESGAGKTEATKYIMQYLARITKKKGKWTSDDPAYTPFKSPDGKVLAALEDRVLSSNPLLETFGNAQTLRNDNSSRFGKFIQINFSTDKGIIVGARISNYLLEKTRITTQIEGERNYHVFYQLFSGASQEKLKQLGLDGGTEGFRYLSNRPFVKNQNDEVAFMKTMQCLRNVGLATEEQNSLLGVTAAVLHIGNITFQEKQGSDEHLAAITEESRSSLTKACDLLGLAEDDVAEAILTKLLNVGGKTIKKPSTVAMAEDKRDALAKMTYSSLFLWLVDSINRTLSQDGVGAQKKYEKIGFIGVLDIYGFECFENNGYEQLLINYCNEKLQRHFNRHLFEVEQNLYSTEGVDWTYITFNDNQPCLDLIEGGGGVVGILNTLDDAYAGMGSSVEKDVKFVSQLHKLFGSVAGAKKTNGGHDYFVTPKFGNDRQFIVCHYAGEVRYNADGFVEKNMESLSKELKELGSTSQIRFARDIFQCGPSSDEQQLGRRSSIRGFSVASQFKQSLQSLLDDLEATQPHYIRCIKPNLNKASNSFASGEVLKQLRYSGMMEAIRIRREGYALREDHQSFFNRFSVLLGSDDVKGTVGIEQLVTVLSARLNVTDADWQIGHTKIFLRRELSDKLERLARLRVHRAARTVGRFGRNIARRQSGAFIVIWMRFRLVMIKFRRTQRAASKIASTYKMHVQYKIYMNAIKAVIKIQSQFRKCSAVRRARKLRDPYCDLTYRDIKKLLNTKKLQMEEAIKAKDFQRAATVESVIDALTISMERKQPMTRSRLDEKIAVSQSKLDDALQRKAYKEAGPLQDEVEKLTALRSEYPTVDELKLNLAHAEQAVAEAARKRDFKSAATLQATADKAKRRLEEAYVDEGFDEEIKTNLVEAKNGISVETNLSVDGVSSRGDLEHQISAIHCQIEEAIAKKDFKLASSLQEKVNKKEKLRFLFPSIDELELKLKSARGKLGDAISSKDFAAAGKLHEEIDELEKMVELEKSKLIASPRNASDSDAATVISTDGSKLTFSSRFDLEEEIKLKKKAQSEEVSARNFKQAQQIQNLIEKLESLREKLPTAAELRRKISDLKGMMNGAIAEKRFVDAERIDLDIQVLEGRLKIEAENEPKSDTHIPSTSTAKVPIQVPGMGIAKSHSSDFSVRSTPILKKRATNTIDGPNTVVGGTPNVRKLNLAPPASVPRSKHFRDDLSDVTSGRSTTTEKKSQMSQKISSCLQSHSEIDRRVSKLRPKKPLISQQNDTALAVAKMMAAKRASSCLVVDSSKSLAGIVTDTDITRRLVAKELDPSSTAISAIATLNPTCVSMEDSAMDALSTMVENGFRHLPVVDSNGVVGVLDIAKCLNDAITKLEKKQGKTSIGAHDALMEVVNMRAANGSQATALQLLLGPLMEKAFGNQTSPSLRSIIIGKPATIVSPQTSVFEAAIKMAESKKAALVVNPENGELLGIFSFKDCLSRCVAKELLLAETEVSSVMTPHPTTISPDASVLEALQLMHSEGILTLPVVEGSGSITGVISILDVIYGAGGVEGWRSIFSSALDMEDCSDDASVKSGKGSTVAGSTTREARSKSSIKKEAQARPVSKLRPKKPLVSSSNDTVLSVAKMLASKRGSASLVVDDEGALAGIVTETDITRRLVAKHRGADVTLVSEIATPNPAFCSTDDSAMEALATMVSNSFRHLPVTDGNGNVVGLLDIGKCVSDAIKKLEKSQSKSTSSVQDALMEVVQDKQIAASLHAVLEKALGNSTSPTLGTLLKGKPSTIISPETTVLEAGMKMAEHKQASLICEEGKLIGIFTFKDMMRSVIAQELSLDVTKVSSVMTPSPDCVSPDVTALEALEILHAGKFTSLPVVADDKTVLGVVNILDIIGACGGAEGWQSVFSSTIDMDDLSDASSVHSRALPLADRSVYQQKSEELSTRVEKPVSNLRPKKPIFASVDDSILNVAKTLASQRSDAAIILASDGSMSGIITDTDFTRRVVSRGLDPSTSAVSVVMTPNPTSVSENHPGSEAIVTMIKNHFRHLPVVRNEDEVTGLLDIARCLNDAITKIERSASTKPTSAESLVKQALGAAGSTEAAALHVLLGPLLSKMTGSDAGTRTLGSILSGVPKTIVSPETSVMDAATVMSENRKATLVVEDGELVGIFGFKDMMTRVVAKGLDPESTLVSEVMTPEPEAVGPDMTALDALRFMHDNRFLTLPCCDDDGAVVGLVDVMDVAYAIGGAEQWRALFDAALEMDDVSDMISVTKSTTPSKMCASSSQAKIHAFPPLPSNIPSTLEFEHGDNDEFDENTLNDTILRMETGSLFSDGNVFVFKIVDNEGHTHRVRSEPKLFNLRNAIADKLNRGKQGKGYRFKYMDEEGDAVLVTSDDDLVDAVTIARAANASGSKLVIKLLVEEGKSSELATGFESPLMMTGIGITIAAVAAVAVVLMKPRSN